MSWTEVGASPDMPVQELPASQSLVHTEEEQAEGAQQGQGPWGQGESVRLAGATGPQHRSKYLACRWVLHTQTHSVSKHKSAGQKHMEVKQRELIGAAGRESTLQLFGTDQALLPPGSGNARWKCFPCRTASEAVDEGGTPRCILQLQPNALKIA